LAHPQGGQAHDDRIIRARLAQAFGRLIRGRGDRGHFVVLSAAFPSRLLTAFPAGTPVVRCTLAEALQRLRAHASGDASPFSRAESSAQSRNDCQNG
jgi:ATP-dependent DNA helicase DinG